MQLQFSVHDPSNPPSPALSSAPSPVVQKLLGVVGAAGSPDPGEEECADEGEALQPPQSQPQQDGTAVEPATTERRKKRRVRIARIKKKAKEKGYEFINGNPIAGVLFVEIQRITDLPPERNATRTSFDMDPFVVISLGRKTYRTRVIRHNLNPVYDEKLLFQVAKHETNYSISFSVVDRDNFTSNDYVGKVDLPLEKVISAAPDADPQTGLYALPDGMRTPTAESTDTKRPRFRLGLSRSSSSQSLSKQARLTAKSIQSPGGHLNVQTNEPVPPTSNPHEGINAQDLSKALSADGPEDGFKPFVLPLNLKNKQKWESKSPTLYIRAKYLPYTALRQQFWRAMLRQYDADESGRIDKLELTTMLDSLGSTLLESTVDKFFERFPEDNPGECPSLAFDEAVICLEDELQRTSRTRPPIFHGVSYSSAAGDDSGSGSPSAVTSSMAGLSLTPSGKSAFLLSPEAVAKEEEAPPLALELHDLSDDRGEEHVIEIRECPICHQPRLNKRSDSDIVTHISTCASQDWRRVNNIVMAGFVTASQAQRKWYSKVMTKISYGGYRLGANSANILVQDRVTGQIQEERMSVYVRLGIRLLYKGLKSNKMEKKRSTPLLDIKPLLTRSSQKAPAIDELQAGPQVRRPGLGVANRLLHCLPPARHERGAPAHGPLPQLQRVLLPRTQARGAPLLGAGQRRHRDQPGRLPQRRVRPARPRAAGVGQGARLLGREAARGRVPGGGGQVRRGRGGAGRVSPGAAGLPQVPRSRGRRPGRTEGGRRRVLHGQPDGDTLGVGCVRRERSGGGPNRQRGAW